MQLIDNFFYIKKIQIPSNVQIIVSNNSSIGDKLVKCETLGSINLDETQKIRAMDIKYPNAKYSKDVADAKHRCETVSRLTIHGPLGQLELNFDKIDSLGLAFFFINKETNTLEVYVKKNTKVVLDASTLTRPRHLTDSLQLDTNGIPMNTKAQRNSDRKATPLGSTIHSLFEVKRAGGRASNVLKIRTMKRNKSFFGSLVSFFQNSIYGICQGFLIYLELNGIGFRAILHERIETKPTSEYSGLPEKSTSTRREEDPRCSRSPDLQNVYGKSPGTFQEIEFKIGQTHELFFKIPKNIRAFSLKPSLFCLYGIEKNCITQVAAEIQNLKLPEPYKGKGIKLKDQIIKIKIGKKK